MPIDSACEGIIGSRLASTCTSPNLSECSLQFYEECTEDFNELSALSTVSASSKNSDNYSIYHDSIDNNHGIHDKSHLIITCAALICTAVVLGLSAWLFL